MTVVAAVVGLLIGGTLGALGGGGAVLTVPALVYLLGESVPAATTASLVVVGVASAVGALGQARSGLVRWRAGLAFAAAGSATAYLGAWLSRDIDESLLMLGFAVVLLVAAFGMLRPYARERVGTTGHSRAGVVVKVLGTALAVGLLTGIFGVGGGFVVVPALVLVLRFQMPVAAATSLLVVALNSAVALTARVGHVSIDWAVVGPLLVFALIGIAVGQKVADRVSSRSLTRAFGLLLVGVAAGVGVVSAASLA